MDIRIHVSGPWATFHRRPLVEALARMGGDAVRIVVVDRPLDLAVAPWRHRDRLLRWLARPGERIRHEAGNLVVVTPFVPVHEQLVQRTAFAQVLGRSIAHQVSRAVPPAGRHVDWIYYPEQAHRLSAGAQAVYEVYDEYNAPDGLPALWRAERERQLLSRVDLVVATAEPLRASRATLHPRVLLVPNGVDLATFARTRERGPLPDRLAAIPEPRIGFLGMMNTAMDVALIEDAVARAPDWSWVFLGPPAGADPEGLRRLERRSNVHMLGWLPRHELAGYLRGVAVGTIPFKTEGAYHQSINPLKLHEYMAAGIPVVSTALSEVEAFAPPVRIARSAPEFVAAIAAWLTDPVGRAEAIAQGLVLAEAASWDRRANQLLAELSCLHR